MNDNVAVLREYLKAVEGLAPREALERFFTPTAVQEEMPNRFFGEGRRNPLPVMMANFEKGSKLLERQQYMVRSTVAGGDRVAVELEWTGTLREGFGSLPAGHSLRAALALFVTFQDGKIAELRSYDCYYPF